MSDRDREDDSSLLAFFERLAGVAGTPAVGSAEATELLRLAKVVADASERRFAPISCYVAGLAVADPALSGAERAERIRQLTAIVHATFAAGA